MRRKERAEEKAELDAAMLTASAPAVEETQPDTKPQQTVVREKTVEPRKRAEKNEKAEKKETPDKTEKTEKDRVTGEYGPSYRNEAGYSGSVADRSAISRLDQGIGSTANRLTMDETLGRGRTGDRFYLMERRWLSAKPITRALPGLESMHHEQQLLPE